MTETDKFYRYLRKNSRKLFTIAEEAKEEKEILSQMIVEKDRNSIEKLVKKKREFQVEAYNEEDCLDEVLKYTLDKYDHLRTIRDVVHFEDLAKSLIDEKEYRLAEQLHFLKLFFDRMKLPKEKELRTLLEKEEKKCYHKITQSIDNYYIQKITK